MATTDIAGLFVTPEQLQAQQAAQDQARALQFASMTPLQQANFSLFSGGQMLGRGLGRVFGGEDPQLRLISQRQNILRTVNPSDPASLMAGIQMATEAGDQQLAMTLTDFANKQASEIAQARQRTAAAERERQQGVPADIAKARELGVLTTALNELEKTPVGTPGREQQISLLKTQIDALKPAPKAGEQIKELVIADEVVKLEEILRTSPTDSTAAKNAKIKLDLLKGTKKDQNQIRELVIAEEIVKLEKIIRENTGRPDTPEVLDAKAKVGVLRSQLKSDKPNLTVVGEVKSGADKGKAVYVDENNDQQFVYDFDKNGKQVRKTFVGDVDRVTSQITASASTSNVGERTVVKGVAELDVEDLKTSRANKRAASASNDSLRNLLALDDSGLISGAYATNRVGVANLLNTLGILSKADSNKLANSQQYEKIGADLIFNALQGKLGAGVSNKDVDFIKEIFPQLETSATARRRLIKYLADKNNKIIEEANNFEAWIRKNKTAEGYKSSNSGAFHVPGTQINLGEMSNEELKALEQKLKGK